MDFFTSDSHFGHANMIKYAKRPFSSVEEMDKTMIARWNAKVGPMDQVWHLGDFAMGCALEYAQDIFYQLNGIKHLIRGNHERLGEAIGTQRGGWRSIRDYVEQEFKGGQRIIMLHYPMRTWHHSYKGTWHLFGHVHGALPSFGKSLDIGVDCWDFAPVSLDELAVKMATLPNAHEIPKKDQWDKTNTGKVLE